MDKTGKMILTTRLVPQPSYIEFREDGEFIISNNCTVILKCQESQEFDIDRIIDIFAHYWEIHPNLLIQNSASSQLDKEGYKINIEPDSLLIEAVNLTGVRYALNTLRQLAEVERGVREFSSYFLPCGKISDRPGLKFRGLHFCWFPETPVFEIEKAVRLAAYYKFNHIILEPWGVFPFKSHPELGWKDKLVNPDKFRYVVDLADKLGIDIIPQFNLLGHASGARIGSSKHALLDFNPKLQALQEPDGWTWCLANKETRKMLADIVSELHEFYGNPEFFHIGCDEAENLCTCRDCRRHSLPDLLKGHLGYFHDLLAGRGARTIMWHDMLLNQKDERWKNYIAFGLPEQHLEKLYQDLPKDIIIADWQYGYPVIDGREPAWPTSRFFKEQGFDVLVCPWLETKGTVSLGKMARREKLFGMLATAWHKYHGAMQGFSIFGVGARAAWEKNFELECRDQPVHRQLFNFHQRQISWDSKITRYEETGSVQYQIPQKSFI
ncbi:MAG: family 20 glycosylhydrolase [Victivallaceae bacterium]|nr:family 20 glycosylhydrolase [Victivallaceae bacterium]